MLLSGPEQLGTLNDVWGGDIISVGMTVWADVYISDYDRSTAFTNFIFVRTFRDLAGGFKSSFHHLIEGERVYAIL